MNPDILRECMALSFADTPFPIVAGKMAAAGVASYRADLIRLEKTNYDDARETHVESIPLTEAPPVAAAFDREAVAASVHAIQQGHLGYAEFLRDIMRAGCSSYTVFLRGRQVIYTSRDGDQLIEHFPAPTSH